MGRAYKNPTEDMALGHIMLEEKRKRRREMRKQNRSGRCPNRTHHRVSVWCETDALKPLSENTRQEQQIPERDSIPK